jgi:hypothetical protein
VNHRGELAQWSWLRGALAEDERRGKMAAQGARSKREGPVTRFAEIQVVEARAAADPIYRAGVEVTPHYKWRCLGQCIYREGIPAGAAVLRDWDD